MGCCLFSPQAEDIYADQLDGDQNGERSNNKFHQQTSIPKSGDLKNSRVQFIKEGDRHKNAGNAHFKAKRYRQAIDAYILAVTSQAPQIVYFTNLALAYKADDQLQLAINIIDEMIKNQSFLPERHSEQYIKGELIKARCLMLIVKNYCLGSDFDVESNNIMLGHINSALMILEKVKDKERLNGEDFYETGAKLRSFLKGSIISNTETQNLLIYLTSKLDNSDAFMQSQSKIAQHYNSNDEILEQVKGVVNSLKKEAIRQEEDYFLDPITYQSLLNPVIVPSGMTYNINTLKQHFKNNGYNDPITHQLYHIGQQVLFPNHSIRAYANQKRKHITQDDLHTLKY